MWFFAALLIFAPINSAQAAQASECKAGDEWWRKPDRSNSVQRTQLTPDHALLVCPQDRNRVALVIGKKTAVVDLSGEEWGLNEPSFAILDDGRWITWLSGDFQLSFRALQCDRNACRFERPRCASSLPQDLKSIPSAIEFGKGNDDPAQKAAVQTLALQQMTAGLIPATGNSSNTGEPAYAFRESFLARLSELKNCIPPKAADAKNFRYESMTPSKVTASTELAAAGMLTYSAPNLIDGQLKTAWIEGVEGKGEGATLAFEFPAPSSLSFIQIANGYQKSFTSFFENSFPTRIEAEFDTRNGETYRQTFDLQPEMGYSRFAIEPRLTKIIRVRLKITKVQKGSRFEDTAISEIRFLDLPFLEKVKGKAYLPARD